MLLCPVLFEAHLVSLTQVELLQIPILDFDESIHSASLFILNLLPLISGYFSLSPRDKSKSLPGVVL